MNSLKVGPTARIQKWEMNQIMMWQLTCFVGERLWWGAEDVVIQKLKEELKAKEETVEALQAQISAMEDVVAKREREVDILRQSLRIMSNPIRSGHVWQ